MHGKKINSNAVATVFDKRNAIKKLLYDAVASEVNGSGGMYYWDKKRATKIAASLGVQFPGSSAIPDGLIRSINDAKSKVKH